MSPQSQDSDDITRMILEGLHHGRPFVPVLVHGERNYHLANTWYVDARDGRLLGPDELALLHRLHGEHGRDQADADSRSADPVAALPPPLARPPVPTIRVPQDASLDRLDGYLAEGEYEHADLLTTALLLEAANRLAPGWMRGAHAAELPLRLLEGIDAVWSRRSHERQGFGAQVALALPVGRGRHADFLRMSVAYGWRRSPDGDVPADYREFVDQAGPGRRPGFFPTLRNPQNERFSDWYDQWTATVLAVHLRHGERGLSR
ncbi:GUN4 domain-containing protein [Streptomyces sp. NBC_01511]|uniref:GUN4 domain-containing protein n=1 Tax=Streptomyces sp. NBC_01511 TaxID=2903889 RepID=UPI00386E95BC